MGQKKKGGGKRSGYRNGERGARAIFVRFEKKKGGPNEVQAASVRKEGKGTSKARRKNISKKKEDRPEK